MKVYLIDAGPGATGLMTLKGWRAMQAVDVVVYGDSVTDGILSLVPHNARKIYIGQTEDRLATQKKIEETLIEEARKGNVVARLRANDPLLNGEGALELAALLGEGIPCEVIPGVSAALASPSYAGIAATHYGLTNGLCIVNGHNAAQPINYEALRQLGMTLIFPLDTVCFEEIEAGLSLMDADTPVAIIEKGTTPRQRRINGTLGALRELAGQLADKINALLIIGQVAAEENTLDWTAHQPLFGKKILIPQTGDTPSKLGRMLREHGAEALDLPLLKVKRLNPATPDFSQFHWLAFTNLTAVTNFFEWLCNKRLDIRRIGNAKIAAMGVATADALGDYGLTVDLAPQKFGSAALADELHAAMGPGEKLLLVCAQQSASSAPLRDKQLNFQELAVYTSLPLPQQQAADADVVVFSTPSVAQAFAQAYTLRPRALCLGAQAAEVAAQYGFDVLVAPNTAITTLVDLLKE